MRMPKATASPGRQAGGLSNTPCEQREQQHASLHVPERSLSRPRDDCWGPAPLYPCRSLGVMRETTYTLYSAKRVDARGCVSQPRLPSSSS